MISYIGGKARIAPHLIVPNIPVDIEIYSEVFGGMFWTYFNMDLLKYPKLKKIVYNDFNPLNYNLFQCVQNPGKLKEAMMEIPCQKFGESVTPDVYKDQFLRFQSEIFNPGFKVSQHDYLVAAKYVYILAQVFSGSKPEKATFVDLKGKYRSKYLSFLDKLTKKDWVDHFISITDVENMDFEDFIDKYDGESTYFYCDPPYWKTEKYYANHEFSEEDHERLSISLKKIKGRFSLSYYYFVSLPRWFPENEYRWIKRNFAKASAAKKGVSQSIAEEILILNY